MCSVQRFCKYKFALTFGLNLNLILKLGSRTLHLLLKTSVNVKYEPNMSKRYICSEERTFASFDMTLILSMQSSFKVTVHLLNIVTLWIKYEPDWTKGMDGEYMLWTRVRTNGQTDHYMALKELCPNKGLTGFIKGKINWKNMSWWLDRLSTTK